MKNSFGDEIPDRLYKYMPWSVDKETGKNYAKELLEKHELFFQYPKKFNDPFDCDLNITATLKDVVDLLKNCMQMFIKDSLKNNRIVVTISCIVIKLCPPHLIISIIKKFYSDEAIDESIDKYLSTAKRGAKKTLKVCCFTEDKNNILMWSHYAEKHTGICCEFSSSKIPDEYIKVHYNDKFLNANFKNLKRKFDSKDNSNFISQKGIIWKYEKEYRITKADANNNQTGKENENNNQLFPFDVEALTGIICGCAMLEKEFQEVINCLLQQPTPINLYKAKKGKYSFELYLEYIGQYGGKKLLSMPINK
jgi:hypothetical protein